MTRRILIGLCVAALLMLGGWLWSRNGLGVWMDAAIAFCS